MRRRRLIKTGVAVLALVAVAASALAYWTTQGSGSAAATAGTLAAPTNVSASSSLSTVSVGWTGSSLSNGTPAQGYYVTRTNTSTSATSAACGSSASSLISGTSCSDTNVPDGTYTYKVTAVYHTWTAASSPSSQVTVVGDATPPTVQSINRHTSSPTNATSVQFDVTFSESVTGVDSGDFSLATTGVGGASISSVSGSGTSYTVTVSTGSGSGTLGLNLVDDDSIKDGAGNKLGGTGTGNGNFTGQTYSIDKTAPVVTVTKVNGSTASFPFSTNQNVTSVGGACGTVSGDSSTVSVTINGSAASPSTATCSSGSWTLTLNPALSAENSYAVAATQTDTAGNSGSSGNQTITIDKTAPAVTVTKVNGSTVTFPLTTNQDVTSIGGTCGSATGDLSSISWSFDGRSGTATCSAGSWSSGTFTAVNIDGTYTAQGSQSDTVGNTGSDSRSVTIDETPPTRTALEFFDTNGNGKVDQVKVTYNENLSGNASSLTPWNLTNVPSGGTLASVSRSGAVLTLTLTEGSGSPSTAAGTFNVAYAAPASGGATDSAGNKLVSFSAAPTDKAAPAPTDLQMLDNDGDGRVDQATVTFSETLASYSAGTTPWTLANVPSSGSLGSVSVSGTAATLTITEGAGAQNTAVGSFTIALATSATGIRDSAGNQSSFSARAPNDGAGPVPTAVTDTNGTTDGKFEQNDTMTVTFSENVTGVAASSNVQLVGGNGGTNDTVAMTNLLSGSPSLGSSSYISGNGSTANFNSSPLTQPLANQVRVTLGACTGTGCASVGTASGTGSFSFSPVTTITDAAGNAAGGSITVTIKLF